MIRRIALSLMVAIAASGTPSAESFRGTVTIALSGETPTMDPHIETTFDGTMVWPMITERLVVSETGTGKITPWLAEKVERLSARQFKFTLRKGVKFTDGAPLNAEAVKYSIGRILNPANRSRQQIYFKSFDRIEVLDEHTFIWHAKEPDNGAVNRLLSFGHIISPNTEKMDKAAISLRPVGTGPYIMKEWTKGSKMLLEANPNWWANGRYPNRPKTLIVRRIPEASVRARALEAGELDLILGVPPQDVSRISKNPKLQIASIPAVRIVFVSFFSAHGGPFADQKVRLAVNYAIDAGKIQKTLLGNYGEIFGQMFHPWNYSGYNPDKKWHGYDPAKSAALLKEAGYPDGFKAVLLTTNGRFLEDKATCEAMAGMLRAVKIDTTCTAQAFPLYRKNFTALQTGQQKGAFMYYDGFGNGGGEPAGVLRGTTACGGGWSGHCFKEIDAAIDKAAASEDPQAQQAAFEQVTDMMKEKVTHKIMFKLHDRFAFNERIDFKPRHDERLHPWEIVVK